MYLSANFKCDQSNKITKKSNLCLYS